MPTFCPMTTPGSTTPESSMVTRVVSRRWLLAAMPVVAAGIAGCAGTTSSSSSSSSSSSAAATASAGGAAAAGSVAALAQVFYKTLDADKQKTVLLDHTLASAERWSNLPQGLLGGSGMGGRAGGAPSGMPSGMPGGMASGMPSGMPPSGTGGGGSQARVGISLGDLTEAQLTALTSLLKAATGSGTGLGYDEIEQQLNADDYLNTHGGGDTYGRKNFYVAFLGSPQDSGTWELQFGGHHLAVANTYTDGRLAGATPSFRGVEPFSAFELDGQTNQPLKTKHAAFVALLAGLSSDQLASAKLDAVFTDLVLKPGQDWAFPTKHEGVQVSDLSAAQKKLALAAIATYVDDIADNDAKTILATYTSELDDTYVGYSGTTALTAENDYVRIDGPSVWIEFSMQHGIVLDGNHPHSVWRDRKNDYGGTQS